MAAPAAAAAAGAAKGGAGAGAGAAKGAAGAGAAKGGGGASTFKHANRALQLRGGGDRDEPAQGTDRVKRAIKFILSGVIGGVAFLVLFICVMLVSVFSKTNASATETGGPGAYPNGSDIPKVYWPMYVDAGAKFKVSPYLLASIHKQETGFSTAPSSKSGLNSFGCCGGPMQFKPSTWRSHATAFLDIVDKRPSSYPLDRRSLPSCRGVTFVTGCMYDDFDAIAGAAHKLHADGATTDIKSDGTHDAVCAYIGACAEVDSCIEGSPNQYCQVIPRALEWERQGTLQVPAPGPGQKVVLLPNGLAAASPGTPEAVVKMVAAANSLSKKPYAQVHFPTHINNISYDCSSSTSHVLWAGGKFPSKAPWCSAQFPSYGLPGAGSWVTVYSKGICDSSGHVFMMIGGLRFDTNYRSDEGPNSGEKGPRWRTTYHTPADLAYLSQFTPRHPEGL